MTYVPKPPQEPAVRRTNWVLVVITVGFLGLAVAMVKNVWGRPVPPPHRPLVDTAYLDQTAWRKSYADLVREKADLSDFDCYACHEQKNPPPLRFDADHNLVVPDEHPDIKMGHGSHNRNNLCYNCHNEANLTTFSTRNGKEIGFADSSQICGSCHGPNYRDWEAGVHGRMNGYWNRSLGEYRRLDCVNCHNPHAPRIPTRHPAPPPYSLRDPAGPAPAHSNPESTH